MRNVIGGSPVRGKNGFAEALPWKTSRNARIAHFFMERKFIPNHGGM
jgi:hypothetical protein